MPRDSDNAVDVNLSISANRNAYLRDWMVRNGKLHAHAKYEGYIVPSEDNPIGYAYSRGQFRIKKIWYDYEEGENPPDTHVPWIAEMMRDLNAEKARQKRRA